MSTRFNYLQRNRDLKEMSSTEAIEMVHWFNEKAFDIPREYLLTDFESLKSANELARTPLPPGTEQFLSVGNSNALFFRGLGKVN